MTDTTFVDNSTPLIVAGWLNDINVAVYRALGSTGLPGGAAPTTAAQVLANLGANAGAANLTAFFQTLVNAGAINVATANQLLTDLLVGDATHLLAFLQTLILSGTVNTAVANQLLIDLAAGDAAHLLAYFQTLVNSGTVNVATANQLLVDLGVGDAAHLAAFYALLVGSGSLSSRRKNVNGGFDIWQRGAGPFTPAASTVTYGCDQWWSVRAGVTNFSVSQQAGTLGHYAFKLQRTAADASLVAISCGHTIESSKCYTAAGKTCTYSFSVKAGANFSGSNLAVAVHTGTGVDQGSAAQSAGTWTGWAATLNTTQAITTTLTRYSFSVAIPAGTKEIGLFFSWVPTGTAGADDSITLEEVQFEVGSLTSFEDVDTAVEVVKCQRYYERVGANGADSIYFAGYQVIGFLVGCPLKWLVQKRAIPAIAIVGSFTLTNCPQPSIANADVDGCAIFTTASATGAWSFYNAAGCFITVNSEL
jgi:hypothetical protein